MRPADNSTLLCNISYGPEMKITMDAIRRQTSDGSGYQARCESDLTDPRAELNHAARLLGKRGGRPRGSFSSPLAAWLRMEIAQRRRQGYKCRESFDILRDTEQPAGRDALTLSDHTSDQHETEPNARVTWHYYRKLWKCIGTQSRKGM